MECQTMTQNGTTVTSDQLRVTSATLRHCAKTAVFAALLACGTVWHCAGCSMAGGANKQMDSVGKLGEMLVEKVNDEGVLDKWVAAMDGHFQDPGVEAYASVTVATGVHAKGVNGNISGNGGGDSTRLPKDVREELVKELAMPISDTRRQATLTILGWNRTAVGGNQNDKGVPPATPPTP